MFKFIEAVSDTVLDTINAVYHDKPLIFIRATFRKKTRIHSSGSEYELLKTFDNIKAASDTVLAMINAAYHDKLLIFIRATFREKLISLHQAVDIN